MFKFLNHHGMVIDSEETMVRWHEFESQCTHDMTFDNLLLCASFSSSGKWK